MDNLFFPFDLSDFPTVDKEKRRDEIIEATKALRKKSSYPLISEGRRICQLNLLTLREQGWVLPP